MKKLLSLFAFLLITHLTYSQAPKTLEFAEICEFSTKAHDYAKPVEKFKDSLEVYLKVNSITLGTNKKSFDIEIREKVAEQTKIYKLDKKSALCISIGRIRDNGNNYYIYKFHLYKKVKGCWEDASGSGGWSKFSLGYVTSGRGYGTVGTSNYLSFSGTVEIN